MLSSFVFGNWGSIAIGQARIAVRTIVMAVGAVVWLGSILIATGSSAVVAAWTALAFLVPIILLATLTRTVSLRDVTIFVLWGGAMVGLAILWATLYSAVAPDHGGGRLRATIQPIVEELVKLAPLLVLLWLARRTKTWTLGATDVLVLGAATGAAFGFVEDSYIRSSGLVFWQGPAWLPVSETVAVGTRMIAGHAVWTTIAAGALGIALLLRARRVVAILIAFAGFAWAVFDHIDNNTINLMGRTADGDFFVGTVKTLTANGFATIYVMLAVVALAIVADLIVLLRTWPGAWPRLRRGLNPTLRARWQIVRTGRGLAFLRWQVAQARRARGSAPADLAGLDDMIKNEYAQPKPGGASA